MSLRLSRRTFLTSGAAATAAACGPAAAPTGPGQAGAAKAAWEAEWERLAEAAKKEGRLVAHTLPGEGYRRVIEAFEQAFPGITVEHTGIFARDFAPRVLQERKAGLYAWDVTMPPGTTSFGSLFPEKVFDPIRPLIFRPDVLGDEHWKGGFEFGFFDNEKQYAFGFTWALNGPLFLNTDLVKEGEVQSFKDLLNPKWKGKIAIADPRTGGASANPLTVAALKHGDDVIKRFFTELEPLQFREPRQGAEQLVRGVVAICIGTTEPIINDFRNQGLAKHIKLIYPEDHAFLFQELIWLMNRAPHPNAAKLYVNWLLSKEGQQVFSKAVETNSRRTDVPPVDLNAYPPEGAEKRYLDTLRQDKYLEVERVREITRELLK